jgi:hypothetical protein
VVFFQHLTTPQEGAAENFQSRSNAPMEATIIDLATLPKNESTERLLTLQLRVREAAEADPAFAAAFQVNPLKTTKERFGSAALPNEGEFVRALAGGGFQLVFPLTRVQWTFLGAEGGELPDELLEQVSAGAPCNPVGPAGSTSGFGKP